MLDIKEEHDRKMEIPFCKITELEAKQRRDDDWQEKSQRKVLGHEFYLCTNGGYDCKERKWNYIGVGKSKRWVTGGQVKRKLDKYGRNVLNYRGFRGNVNGLRKNKKYRLDERIGKRNKLGTVKIVFARRKGENKHIEIVTDDLRASMKTVVADYLKRWSIEMLSKDVKQHWGLGDYRVLR